VSRPLSRALLSAIESSVSPITARTILTSALQRLKHRPGQVTAAMLGPELTREIERGLRLFRTPEPQIAVCASQLREVYRTARGHGLTDAGASSIPCASDQALNGSLSIDIRVEDDIVKARNEARDVARRLGFSTVDQVKIATVVSELTRNIVSYAGTGTLTTRTLRGPEGGLEIVATDSGPGIRDLDQILGGTYVSKTGMGLGLLGSKRVMDDFSVTTGSHGTRVVVKKRLRV
jgi:serine/threonine-protein kinase RsbT